MPDLSENLSRWDIVGQRHVLPTQTPTQEVRAAKALILVLIPCWTAVH